MINGNGHNGVPVSGIAIDRGASRESRPAKPCTARMPGSVWCVLPDDGHTEHVGPTPRELPPGHQRLKSIDHQEIERKEREEAQKAEREAAKQPEAEKAGG